MRRLVEARPDQDARCERLGRLVQMLRLPPEAAAALLVPPGDIEEAERLLGVLDVALVVRDPVGVEEGDPPPAVVVEVVVDVGIDEVRVVGVGADRLHSRVPVLLGTVREVAHGLDVFLGRVRDRDPVDRVEHLIAAPEHHQRRPPVGLEELVVPAELGVPPEILRPRDAVLGELEESRLIGAQLRPVGKRRHAVCRMRRRSGEHEAGKAKRKETPRASHGRSR